MKNWKYKFKNKFKRIISRSNTLESAITTEIYSNWTKEEQPKKKRKPNQIKQVLLNCYFDISHLCTIFSLLSSKFTQIHPRSSHTSFLGWLSQAAHIHTYMVHRIETLVECISISIFHNSQRKASISHHTTSYITVLALWARINQHTRTKKKKERKERAM